MEQSEIHQSRMEVEVIDYPNIVRFDEIEIGNMFFDPATQLWFVKETEHTAGSSGGAHLEFAPGHPVSVNVETRNGTF